MLIFFKERHFKRSKYNANNMLESKALIPTFVSGNFAATSSQPFKSQSLFYVQSLSFLRRIVDKIRDKFS
jgi:hypothetical protein